MQAKRKSMKQPLRHNLRLIKRITLRSTQDKLRQALMQQVCHKCKPVQRLVKPKRMQVVLAIVHPMRAPVLTMQAPVKPMHSTVNEPLRDMKTKLGSTWELLCLINLMQAKVQPMRTTQ